MNKKESALRPRASSGRKPAPDIRRLNFTSFVWAGDPVLLSAQATGVRA